ncbi:hypothetical protein C7U89_17135 [Bradyrhizobium sp. WBOS4]|nr:hypothetical protein [Bradyrhizobium sp. WBOS8]MDD1584647.1 hypothetical protein [Bradyrhizobium sp. WBOS4]UUO47826.1 hypothetical protein DCM78_13390 [Bradyrhizobium sp. WBOS04]UUO61508.1 hypothetical protein DCM80_21525 [Bradyrhizobium sp. WBOS08]
MCRLYEGCGVGSVASREMAAGLQALSAMTVFVRWPAPSRSMDQLQPARRSLLDRFERREQRGAATLAGIAVSRRKPTEIRFRGAAASCYPGYSRGAEGIVTITSRRPN